MSELSHINGFMDAIYRYCDRDEGMVEFRAFPGPNGVGYRKQVFHSLAEKCPVLPNGTNWFIGAATRHRVDGKVGGGSEYVYEIPAVWVDCDSQESCEALAKFPLIPTCVLNTSEGRQQAWWRLTEVYQAENWNELQPVVLDLADIFHADRNSTDLARVLRIPGYSNYKYAVPYMVSIHSLHAENEYDLSNIQEHIIYIQEQLSYKLIYNNNTERTNNIITKNIDNNIYIYRGGSESPKVGKFAGEVGKSRTKKCEVEKSRNLAEKGSGELPSGVVVDFEKGRARSIFNVLCALKDQQWTDRNIRQVAECLMRGCTAGADKCERTVEQIVQWVSTHQLPNARRISVQVRRWIEAQDDWWTRKELIEELNIPKSHWRTVTEIIRYERQKDLPTIIAHPTKPRTYKAYSSGCVSIKAIDSDDLWEWDLALPLGLSDAFYCGPKSIVMVGGVSGHGKTTMVFNAIYNNIPAHGKKITYISTEVDSYHYSEIIEAYPEPERFEQIRKLKLENVTYEGFVGLIPMIDPDGITVIDYLELYEDVFLVGRIINELFNKIRTGVLILCMQKKPTVKENWGGIATRFKANLAVILENGVCEIVKVSRRRGKDYCLGKKINYTVTDNFRMVEKEDPGFGEGDF